MINNKIIAALAIVAMVGCQKANNVEQSSSPLAIQFSSSDTTTRVIENTTDGSFSWEQGDKIGITSTAFGDGYSTTYFSNVCYSATSTASTTNFEAAGEECVYMSTGMDDNFVFNAFYPYSDSDIVDIDISDQSDLSKFNYLIASTSQYMSYFDGSDPVIFTFKNLLSQVVFNLDFDTTVDLDSETTMSAILSNVVTTATYNTTTLTTSSMGEQKGSVALNCVLDSDNRKATITARFIPGSLSSSSTIRFNIGGDIYNLAYNKELESGLEYVHEVLVSVNEIIID